MRLFERKIALTVGSKRWRNLHLSFEIDKSLSSGPNQGKITVYNLSADSRKSVEESGTPVLLEAGYDGGMSLLYSGAVAETVHGKPLPGASQKSGVDWVTTIELADGIELLKQGVSVSLAAGLDLKIALVDVLKTAGVAGAGALLMAQTLPALVMPGGFAAAGSLESVLAKILANYGYGFTVLDSLITLHPIDQALTPPAARVKAPILREGSGLIGSPEKLADGRVAFMSLLTPDAPVNPGGVVILKSGAVNGMFRVDTVKYTGDFPGPHWYCLGQGEPI